MLQISYSLEIFFIFVHFMEKHTTTPADEYSSQYLGD